MVRLEMVGLVQVSLTHMLVKSVVDQKTIHQMSHKVKFRRFI
jgi:hypothetical protein